MCHKTCEFFSDNSKHYVLFSSLGGFTGSSLSLAICKKLEKENIKYCNIVNLPPNFMSSFRRNISLALKEEFNSIGNTFFICVLNYQMAKN